MFFSKNKKNIKYVLLKIFDFYNLKNLYILQGRVFVMFVDIYNMSFSAVSVVHYVFPMHNTVFSVSKIPKPVLFIETIFYL